MCRQEEGVPVALAGSGSASPTGALVSISLADGVHLQGVHADAGVEHLGQQMGAICVSNRDI